MYEKGTGLNVGSNWLDANRGESEVDLGNFAMVGVETALEEGPAIQNRRRILAWVFVWQVPPCPMHSNRSGPPFHSEETAGEGFSQQSSGGGDRQ